MTWEWFGPVLLRGACVALVVVFVLLFVVEPASEDEDGDAYHDC